MPLPQDLPTDTPVEEQFVIEDLETLKVVADPLRKRILELLDKPGTVKVVARQLGMSPSKLYYHVNLLEEHGLLRVTDTRIVSGIIEKHYQVAARTIGIKSGLLSPSSGDEALNLMLDEMLDRTGDEIRAAARAGVIEFDADAPKQRKLFMSRSEVTLTEAQAQAFLERLKALVDSFADDEADEDTPGVQEYVLQVSMFPRLTAPRDSTPDA